MRTAIVTTLLLAWPAAEVSAQPPAPAPPPVTITLGPRQGRATPQRHGFNHTGGGNIDVAQPVRRLIRCGSATGSRSTGRSRRILGFR